MPISIKNRIVLTMLVEFTSFVTRFSFSIHPVGSLSAQMMIITRTCSRAGNQALHPSDDRVHLQNKLSFRRWGNANVRAICPSPFISSAVLRQRKKTDPQHGLCSCKSWPRRHEADGGQEELDWRWVSLPSGSSRRRRNLQLQSMRSCPRIGFRRTRTQSAAVDGTQ